MSVVDEPGHAHLVDDNHGGHTAKLEKIYFLAVQLKYLVLRIRDPNKWQFILSPIGLERLSILGANNKNNRIQFNKLIMIIAQLRHMFLAKRSSEAAIEDQQNVLRVSKFRQGNKFLINIY